MGSQKIFWRNSSMKHKTCKLFRVRPVRTTKMGTLNQKPESTFFLTSYFAWVMKQEIVTD